MADKSLLLLAGEASGDYHGAALVRKLKERRPSVRVTGIGGDRLADAGMELLHHYSEINTVGFSEAWSNLRRILRAYGTMKRELAGGGHDLFIPVDFPDVNLRLCKHARASGVPVCYYISPQVWAWRKGRIRKIAQRVDKMMTIFPFEETLYRQVGVNADFVGHTMIRDLPDDRDRVRLRSDLGMALDTYTVALVPGSRGDEIRRMLPRMCRAAAIHVQDYPDTQFVLPLAGTHVRDTVSEVVDAYDLPILLTSDPADWVMAASDCGLVTSGTATLQAALVGMPHVVVYVLGELSWWVAMRILRPLLMDKDLHVAIANVLSIQQEKTGPGPISTMVDAGHEIQCLHCGRPLLVPEIVQHWATPQLLADWLARFRTDASLCSALSKGFEQIRNMLEPREQGSGPADIVSDMLDDKVRGSQ